MASYITRRNFLKCAGITALAITASGIFTGCSEGGGGEISGLGVNQTVTTSNGVKIKLLGYQQYPLAEMGGNYSGQTMIQACFAIDNQSGGTIQMGNTTQDYLDKVWDAIYKNKFDTLTKGDFVTATKNGQLDNVAIAYKTSQAGPITFGVIGTLEDKEKGCIKVFIALPDNWDQVGIRYTPHFAKDKTFSFVLNSSDKIS